MKKNTVIEFLNVTRAEIDQEALWGFAIDYPKKGDQANTYTIKTTGWVLGKESPVVAVEVLSEGRILGQVPVNMERPGVSKRYPEVLWAKNSGFNIEVGVIGLPLEGEVRIRGVLENKSKVLLGIVHYRRLPLHSNYQAQLQALVFTSVGRSGTTWLMRLFSQHPSIITSESYPYEFLVSQYWMQMLNILSQPRHPQKFYGAYFYEEYQSIGPNPYYGKADGDAANDWLGRDYPEQLADFCRQSIDNLYQHMGCAQGKLLPQLSGNTNNHQHQPLYFVEKFLPNPHRKLLLEVYPQAKEIVLVRDFRDILCSALAFNTKRKYLSFGRQRVDSDREYIQTTIKNTAANLLGIWRQRKEQVHLVRYEDLILAPEQTLSDIFAYLNLDHSSSTISKILAQASEDTPKLKYHRTTDSPQESIGRWQKDLEPSLKALCTEVCREALEQFGYSLTGEEKLSPLPKLTIKPEVKAKPSLVPVNSNLATPTESALKKLEQIKYKIQNIKASLEQS